MAIEKRQIKNWMSAKSIPTIDPNGKPAKQHAHGLVTIDNLFLCECGSVMKNGRRNLVCHLSKKHREESAYNREKFKGRPWRCACCHLEFRNLGSWLTHQRQTHGFRGDSSSMRQRDDPNRPESTLQRVFQMSLLRRKGAQ
ncbi:hypothetical protein F5Y05DRAFT_409790 [Hypoxylon sp. FL0543]|nr:hypothetical protein F5Y05DRAFT_409790 [Hypoxylon sp. FL0543]